LLGLMEGRSCSPRLRMSRRSRPGSVLLAVAVLAGEFGLDCLRCVRAGNHPLVWGRSASCFLITLTPWLGNGRAAIPASAACTPAGPQPVDDLGRNGASRLPPARRAPPTPAAVRRPHQGHTPGRARFAGSPDHPWVARIPSSVITSQPVSAAHLVRNDRLAGPIASLLRRRELCLVTALGWLNVNPPVRPDDACPAGVGVDTPAAGIPKRVSLVSQRTSQLTSEAGMRYRSNVAREGRH
jgi:hypothetical protein